MIVITAHRVISIDTGRSDIFSRYHSMFHWRIRRERTRPWSSCVRALSFLPLFWSFRVRLLRFGWMFMAVIIGGGRWPVAHLRHTRMVASAYQRALSPLSSMNYLRYHRPVYRCYNKLLGYSTWSMEQQSLQSCIMVVSQLREFGVLCIVPYSYTLNGCIPGICISSSKQYQPCRLCNLVYLIRRKVSGFKHNRSRCWRCIHDAWRIQHRTQWIQNLFLGRRAMKFYTNTCVANILVVQSIAYRLISA